MKPFCHLLSDTMLLLGLFQQLKLLFDFATRKLLGRAFLPSFQTSSAQPQMRLCINVRNTCWNSKISVNRSGWHHKVTIWIWKALLDLCLIQRCASPPLLSGALPEWTICGFAKKKATTRQRATYGFRHTYIWSSSAALCTSGMQEVPW